MIKFDKLKILLVITKSEIGGAQVFVLHLAKALKRLGYEVEVAAGDGDYLVEELKKCMIPFHYLDSLKRNVSVFSSMYFILDFYRLLKTKNYDIIHLNSSNTLVGSISTRILRQRPKTLFTFHGLSLLDRNYKASFSLKFLARLYFKIFLRSVDKIIFVSRLNYEESIKTKMVKIGEVVLNGLDDQNMNFLSREDARKFFSKLCKQDFSSNFILGSTGRLAYPKNYEFLVNNYLVIKEKIPNIKVIIIGDGPYHEKLNNEIHRMNIQNDFFLVGAIKDSYKYIKAYDVFTLPSRYEGLSISLIEAIFARIPVLASEVGGNSEIVGGDSKQLFRLGDIKDFITKLLEIKKDSEKIIELNEKLRVKFSLDKMVGCYKTIYDEMLKN